MGKILAFTRPSDDSEDIEELLRDFYAEERAERECQWLEEAVRRAKEIPRLEEEGQALGTGTSDSLPPRVLEE